MSDNPNKTILAVVIALAIILVLLLANAGSCSRTGGIGTAGGAGGAAATATTSSSSTASSSPSSASSTSSNTTPAQQGASTSQSATATASSSASASTSTSATASASATASTSQQLTIDQALTTVRATQAQVGANARSASSSQLVTAADTYASLAARSLGGVQLSSDFDASGTYVGASDIQTQSTEVYPSYQGIYQSANDVYWILFINEGKMYATPVATSAAKISNDVIVCESDTITQYDALANQFSDFTLQDLSAAGTHAVKVPLIDQATLDSYTATQIEAM